MTHCLDNSGIRHPAAILPGGRIGIAAPASPFDRDLFFQGIEVIKQMGFEPVFAERIFLKTGYFAGTCQQRARELQDFFDAPDIQAVWCVRGGYGSMRLLDALDYERIEKHPKIFVGCSDITALLAALYHKCRMITFHGPMVASLARADSLTIESVVHSLSGKGIAEIKAVKGRVIRPGKAAGRVLGGNLSTLCHLLATPYFPDLTGKILFLEDIGEKPYRIDRMLTHMHMAGCFNSLAGLAAGSFTRCGSCWEIDRIFTDIFGSGLFPVVTGFPAGHGMPNKTLPMGAVATLDSNTMALAYHEHGVCLSKEAEDGFFQ